MISLTKLRDYAALADMAYTDLSGISFSDGIDDTELVKQRAINQTRTPEKLGEHLFDSNWSIADFHARDCCFCFAVIDLFVSLMGSVTPPFIPAPFSRGLSVVEG